MQRSWIVLALACARAVPAFADGDTEVIEIDDSAPAESASSVHLTEVDLEERPRTQMSDILRQVPGLMVSQHAGGGKSDQYFIRGFDADHGTDIAIFADGVPVNLPSHGHGQGYADTHFMIPETVGGVDIHKGPYAARFGDFYTAGALELKTLDAIAGPTVWIAGGTPLAGPTAFDNVNRRLVAMASPTSGSLLAAEIGDTDGPFEQPQDFRQGNALAKWKRQVGDGELALEGTFYQAKWHASGQVPEQAIAQGLVDRFGSLDNTEGGDTMRASGQGSYSLRDSHGGNWRARVYGLAYRLKLFSDFTLYARDPVRGDEIEQDDQRFVYGVDAAYDRHLELAKMDTLFTVGVQARDDDVNTALWHADQRVRLESCYGAANPCNRGAERIRDAAVYAEATVHVIPHVHVLPGLRIEGIAWDVDGKTAANAVGLPKLSVEIEASEHVDVYVNGGSGFHSNDARAAVASNGNGAIARALGGEVGVRTSLVPHAKLQADLWYLHLDSELVWSGDEGGTEAAGSTRRYGLDVSGVWRPWPWLAVDATASLAHAAFVANAGNGSAVALAPRLMGQGGVTATRARGFVALRGRGIADRPGNDSGTLTAEGYFIFDVIAGECFGRFGVNVTVNNLLNSDWREAQFANTVAIAPGAPAVEQMTFTPGVPLTATASVSYTY